MENRVLSWLRTLNRDRRTAMELYGAIVTQARQPVFFAPSGVSDTAEGRAGMIMLHLFLVLDRLAREAEGARLARRLTETFVADLDDGLREMGVGDLAVPKKVKRAVAGLEERYHIYRRALETGDDRSLAAELAASVPGLERDAERALALARYVCRSRAHLAALALGEIIAGGVTFPTPDAMI